MQDLHRAWGRNLARLMEQHVVGFDPETLEPIRGISIKRLAEETGIDRSTISKTISGDMMLSDTKKGLVCGVLDKHWDEVFPWPIEKPKHPSTYAAAEPPKVARQATPTKRAARRKAA